MKSILGYWLPTPYKEAFEERAPLGPDPYTEPEKACIFARRLHSELPPELVEKHLAVLKDPEAPSALYITNAPLGNVDRPPQFDAQGRPIKTDFISEYFVLTLATLGTYAVSVLGEHGGHLVHNILPTLEGRDAPSSASSRTALPFHRENLDLESIDALVIGAGYIGSHAETLVADTGAAWQILTDSQRKDLRNLEVEVRAPASRSGRVTWSQPRPFITGTDVAPEVVYAAYGNTLRLVGKPTLSQCQALAALEQHLATVSETVVMQPSSVLVLSNLRTVHARGAFEFNGEQESLRHLQRVQCAFKPRLGGKDGMKLY